jgi:hypothetical protein
LRPVFGVVEKMTDKHFLVFPVNELGRLHDYLPRYSTSQLYVVLGY